MRLLGFTNEKTLVEKLQKDLNSYEATSEILQERIAELELALEDQDWNKLGDDDNANISKENLKKINRLAKIYWLKNPMIKRAVYTQTSYVFGQGMNIQADDEDINAVVQGFLEDSVNKKELTEHQSRMVKETELQLYANIFFVLFVNRATGKVRIRTIPPNEITKIIKDSNDSKKPLYYQRKYIERYNNYTTGGEELRQVTRYYKDWENQEMSTTYAGKKLEEGVVYHVAVNKLSDMDFGVSEVYAAMDWAKAYKEFLEDWATIVKSYARFAWRVVTKGQGKAGVKRAKDKLGSTLSSDNANEKNPSPSAGSTFVSTDNTRLEPIKTAGATTKAEDGNKMIHMVSAATGIFYHYLVGDPSTGNLATAKTMERPMELMFMDRQTLWKSVFNEILTFVIRKAISAPKGTLKGKGNLEKNDWGEWVIKWKEDVKHGINITFPPILEKDINESVTSIVNAATLGGRPLAGVISDKEVSRLLMNIIGVENVDEKINELYPEDEEGQPKDEATVVVRDAIRNVKNSLEKFMEYDSRNNRNIQ